MFSACLRKVQAYILLAMFLALFGPAQEMSSVPARITIPDGTSVELQLAETISSARAHVGDDVSLQRAFARAGWVRTDKWRPMFVWHLLQHGINDAKLPMARFNLYGRVQDYSYALPDPEAVVSRRHHLRIWKTGCTVNETPIWVGAATHDLAIEIAKRGHLINHRIDPDVDAERNFIGAELAGVSSVIRQKYLLREDPVFRAQTVSGEKYYSDSRILFLDLQQASLSNADVLKQSSIIIRASTGPIAVPAASLQSHLASAH